MSEYDSDWYYKQEISFMACGTSGQKCNRNHSAKLKSQSTHPHTHTDTVHTDTFKKVTWQMSHYKMHYHKLMAFMSLQIVSSGPMFCFSNWPNIFKNSLRSSHYGAASDSCLIKWMADHLIKFKNEVNTILKRVIT